jgi:Domain of unknown function (DUF4388)
MSQVTTRARAQRLADSVLPGRVLPRRTVGGYVNLIEARLRKLAATASTGMLPMSGHGDGAIFFRGGRVVYAQSSRTPTPAGRTVDLAALGLVATDASPPANGAELVAAPSFDRLVDLLALTEPTIDAVTELLSSESRYAKFRPCDDPPSGQTSPLPIETVLTEVERRRQVLRQLEPVVTADSPIVRFAPSDPPSFQVSASQWALLVRTGGGSTPRTVALALGRSVFGTTIEVYRLLALGLLVVPGHAHAITVGAPAPRPAEVMSFMRALSDAGGGDA